jgi:hypothetical protein
MSVAVPLKPLFMAPQFVKVEFEETRQEPGPHWDELENEIDFYLNKLLQAYGMEPTSKKPAHPYRRKVSLTESGLTSIMQ